MIMMTPEQKAALRAKICSMPIFQVIGGMLTPLRAMTGGIPHKICPGPNDPNPADLAKPSDSAEGAAAKIKKMEAEAKARRAAVRYLGTVDCSRFPEAEAALINSLRGDTNECVRLEAALALGNGCCCTKKIIDALTDTVSCKKTNDPPETSPRVRAAAARALAHCLHCFREVGEAPKPPEKGVAPPPPETPPEKGTEPPALPKEDLPPPRLSPDVAESRARARRVLDAYRYGPTRLQPVAAQPDAPNAPPGNLASTPPAVARVQTPGPIAPPTGRRDVWSLLMFSGR
jgi:hypothetical protein